MISKQILIFLLVIFFLVQQFITCLPTLEKDTTSFKSDVKSVNNEVPRTTTTTTTNKPVVQRTQTPLPRKSFAVAQTKADSTRTIDEAASILTRPSGTTSQIFKKPPLLPESPVVNYEELSAFLKNMKPNTALYEISPSAAKRIDEPPKTLSRTQSQASGAPVTLPLLKAPVRSVSSNQINLITEKSGKMSPSASNSIVESPKTSSRTQPQSSGGPVTVSSKVPVVYVPEKQSNLVTKTPAVKSPESVKTKASQPGTSLIVPRTLSKSIIQAPIVTSQQKHVPSIMPIQQKSTTPAQSNTLPEVATVTSKLPSAMPKIKVEPAKTSSVTTRSLNSLPGKPNDPVFGPLYVPNQQNLIAYDPSTSPFQLYSKAYNSPKELVSKPNPIVASTRGTPTAKTAIKKRTPSQNIVSTKSLQRNDDLPEKKRTYDTNYNDVESGKELQKQNSMRIPGVIKSPMNWAWKPVKSAWNFANLVKNKVTGNNVAP